MTHFNHNLPPAIVVAQGFTALGALRSLAMAGIPVHVACPAADLATHSRWYRATPGPVRWDGSVGPRTCDTLRDMPLADAVLIPGADDVALWLADFQHSALASRFRICSSSRKTLEILQDKTRFGEFLAHNAIPHPRTFPIACPADIDAIAFPQLDRVFIKPADSQHFNNAFGVKGIWVRNAPDAQRIYRQLDAAGFAVIAQEYVPGSASDHYFLDGFRDRNGALAGLFARRRVRIYPPDFGNSSYCRSIPLPEVAGAVASLDTLLSKLDYRGIFSAEFKRDARDGVFRILEVNTRAWWYVEFAARCGVNVCQMAYQDALGQPLTATATTRNYPVGAGCVNLDGDIKAVLAAAATTRGSWWSIAREWTHAYFHVFRLDDPRPGLSVVRRMLRTQIRKCGSAIARAAHPSRTGASADA